MKIVVMEPLGVALEKINALAAALQAAGHEFVYYTSKEAQQDKLLERVQDADIIMLANQPLSAEIINACPKLKMLSVAFTGVDHVALVAYNVLQVFVALDIIGTDNLAGVVDNLFRQSYLSGNLYGERTSRLSYLQLEQRLHLMTVV